MKLLTLKLSLMAAFCLSTSYVSAEDEVKQLKKVESTAEVKEDKSAYWLGVQLGSVPKILQQHVPELRDGGAMAVAVAPNSPAQKAGLKANDVIVRAAGKPVMTPQDLTKIIQDMDSSELRLDFLQDGIVQQKTASLEKRKSIEPVKNFGFGQNLLPNNPLRLRMFGPGELVQGSTKIMTQTESDGIKIQVERSDDQAAKIRVEKDGKTWNVTENNLNQLPPEVRGKVKQQLDNLKINATANIFNGPNGGLKGKTFEEFLDKLPADIRDQFKDLQNGGAFGNGFGNPNGGLKGKAFEELLDKLPAELRDQIKELENGGNAGGKAFGNAFGRANGGPNGRAFGKTETKIDAKVFGKQMELMREEMKKEMQRIQKEMQKLKEGQIELKKLKELKGNEA